MGHALSLRFLYDRCREWREEGREVADALWEFLEFTGLNQKVGSRDSPPYKRLGELVATNAGVEQRRKLRWLRSGILPNAMSFASFVDLRPNFSADRSSVQELVPIVIFRILAESDDSGPKGTVFQLTPEALGNLKKAVEDTERKLSALKSDAAFADRRFALSIPDQDDDEDD